MRAGGCSYSAILHKWRKPSFFFFFFFFDIVNYHPVPLFGGHSNSAAIGSEGEVIFINRGSVFNSPIPVVSLPNGEKASSVACYKASIFVLSSNGRVFSSKIESNSTIRTLNFQVKKLSVCQENKTTAWLSARKVASLDVDQIMMANSALAKEKNQQCHLLRFRLFLDTK